MEELYKRLSPQTAIRELCIAMGRAPIQSVLFAIIVAIALFLIYKRAEGYLHDLGLRKHSKRPSVIEAMKHHYERQARERSTFLRNIDEKTKKFGIYNVLVPEVICPNLLRIGAVDDGGKWFCNPFALPRNDCVIYSLGISNEPSFDIDLQKMTGYRCKIYGVDMNEQLASVKAAYRNINGVLEKGKISLKTNHSAGEFTIEDFIRFHNHSYIEVIKIDIEAAEFSTVPQFLENFTPCQLFLEMHTSDIVMNFRDLLVTVARHDYYLFSHEINGYNINGAEYSFIHESCMERYGAILMAAYIKYAK